MRPINPALLIFVLTCAASPSFGHERLSLTSEPSLEARPNVVFFLVDDLGWTDLGCYGSTFYETPNIDRLAKRGVRFTDAYAACHVCSPTRAAIMTGQYPARLQLTDWLCGRRDFPFQRLKNAHKLAALPSDALMIAEVLKEAGYATGHFGKWHLGEDPLGPQAQGFDQRVPEWNKGWPRAGYHPPFQLPGIDDSEDNQRSAPYLTDRLTDKALDFIEANRETPFFLYLTHFAVHDPIQGREDLVAKYEAKKAQLAETRLPFILEGNPDSDQPLTADERENLVDAADYRPFKLLPRQTVKIKQHQDNPQFAAMVESIDESLGRVLDKLDSLDLSSNTLIILTSDNGGMSAANFGRPSRVIQPTQLDRAFSTSNLPLRGAKGWLYEGGIRVPLIIHCPWIPTPTDDCSVPASSIDFFPTILELARLELPADGTIDGTSLVPLLKGKTQLSRDALYWHFPHYSNHGLQSPGGAIRKGRYKLLEYFENGTVQLFDLESDLGEQKNLADQLPDISQAMQRELDAWRQSVDAAMMPKNTEFDSTASPSDF